MRDLYEPDKLGGIFLKGLTLEACPGNTPPRLVETPAGIINSIGLENPGIYTFIEEVYPEISSFKTTLIPNLAGFTCAHYLILAELIEQYTDLKAVEINISCPNVHAKGKVFASNLENVTRIISDIKANTSLYIIAKLPPAIMDIESLGVTCQNAGCDALSVVNTVPAMDIDPLTARPVLGNIVGGLSGPAIRPLALRCVYLLYEAVSLPIIGIGGIDSLDSALKFTFAGSSILSLGTVNFYNPSLPPVLIDEMQEYCRNKNIESWNSLVGKTHREKG